MASKKTKQAPRAKARAKAKPKRPGKARARKPAPGKSVRAASKKKVAAPRAAVSSAVEVRERSEPPPPPKPGALARLKSGVGSLFAKVTGRGNKPEALEPERTIEIKTEDILLSEDRASARASKE